MFDSVLDLPLHFLVVFVTATGFKIDEQAIFIVEGKQGILFRWIDLKLTLKSHRVGAWGQVSWAAIETVTIFWDVFLDANAMLLRNDIILVVNFGAILADDFRFLDVNKNFIR